MGIKATFKQYMESEAHTQNVTLQFFVEVFNEAGNPDPGLGFGGAEYTIRDSKDRVWVTKTLGNGIRKDRNVYSITVPFYEMSFAGTYLHQFTLITQEGERLSPVFNHPLLIKAAA